MTRTERATSPRAIIKDRSESKSGMDKRTPKGGAGTHNWGSLINERDLEDAALYDENGEEQEKEVSPSRPSESRRKSSNSLTEEERQEALKVRKNALKSKDVDLAAIARSSSAVSTSPPSTTPIMSDADTTK